MLSLTRLFVTVVAMALLSSCATLNMIGPPIDCLSNADAAGRKEGDIALKAGYSPSQAASYANGVRNSVRVACAVLGTIIVKMDQKIADGMSVKEANAMTGYRLDALLMSGFASNMVSNPKALGGNDPEALARQIAEQAADYARYYVPTTAAGFHDHTAGWREVVKVVSNDRNIPGAMPVIQLAQQSARGW